ncbi:MAG: hypothetical protein ABEJ26_01765 [Halosimplex sp.]
MHEFELTGGPEDLGESFATQVAESDRSLAEVAPETLAPSPAVREFARECEPHVAEHAPGPPATVPYESVTVPNREDAT